MTVVVPQCLECQHFDEDDVEANTCAAFPLGIPSAILLGRFDHRKAFPDDRGIRFERKAEVRA